MLRPSVDLFRWDRGEVIWMHVQQVWDIQTQQELVSNCQDKQLTSRLMGISTLIDFFFCHLFYSILGSELFIFPSLSLVAPSQSAGGSDGCLLYWRALVSSLFRTQALCCPDGLLLWWYNRGEPSYSRPSALLYWTWLIRMNHNQGPCGSAPLKWAER